jgi:hypothetical protein
MINVANGLFSGDKYIESWMHRYLRELKKLKLVN